MDTNLAELRKTLDKIAALDERRANLLEYRNRQLKALRDSGMTWRELQEFAGLSPRGLKLAIDAATASGGR